VTHRFTCPQRNNHCTAYRRFNDNLATKTVDRDGDHVIFGPDGQTDRQTDKICSASVTKSAVTAPERDRQIFRIELRVNCCTKWYVDKMNNIYFSFITVTACHMAG